MAIEVRVLGRDDADLLSSVVPGVFDDAIDVARAAEFLADPRHHLVVALSDAAIVGFASSVHYLHPDKPEPEFWINEIGVAPAHRGGGVGRRLVAAILEVARNAGCKEAWVLADTDNPAAIHLYSRVPHACSPAPQLMFTFPLNR
jgi:ribosomal protein S18 acetylase RimI-like enzyme